MKAVRTWILIADSERARVLQNNGPGHGLAAIDDMSFSTPHLEARDIMADRPGRSFDSTGHTRHAMEYSSDPKRLHEITFMKSVADALAANAGRYDRLILVAAPRALGDLRQALAKQVHDKVTADLDKDLTNIPEAKLAEHLASVIAL
jgi:protein required for attachment to host cells